MIRDKVAVLLQQAIAKTGIEDSAIALAHPANPEHGDFSTSIALKYAKKRGVSPMELAQQIANHIEKGTLISTIEVIKPGFINLHLSQEILINEMKHIQSDSPYGQGKQDKKVVVEYGQPNTHKLPHIGHLFSYVYGESLSRIFAYQGNTVIRANYQGDIGLHVAKCLYAYISRKPEGTLSLHEKVQLLQTCYQTGSEAYENDVDAREEIDAINKALYHEQDADLIKIWKETRSWSVQYYDEFQKSLGIVYDRSYFETDTWKIGKELVETSIGTVFERSQNAVIFRGEDHGLHTRVFINKHGNPTYEAKELGLYAAKMRDLAPFDLSITTTASEQNEYFKVIFKAVEQLFPQNPGTYKHLGYGMINLTSGKMSSRTGEIVGAVQLVEMTTELIKSAFDMQDSSLALSVAHAAIKYSFLKSDPFKNMTFDLEKSIARDGDSGPYLLYTYVRTQSILRQAAANEQISLNDVYGGVLNTEERAILQLLHQFPEVIETAAQQYMPSVIATYLFTLAQSYNLFYQKHQVLKADDAQKALRLAITSRVGIILKSGLRLLGIETVEKM
ncbi:arginine--tRNA ligase [Candidatus Microgenomates bacterium]|nr:arginine--tRNA ligase [Candidatus Microgenomates bacterium]